MERIEILKNALAVWNEYVSCSPKFYPWISRDISFLIEVEQRRLNGEKSLQNEEDVENLLDLTGRSNRLGPFSGIAVHDISDNNVCSCLIAVQNIVREMATDFNLNYNILDE